MASRHRSRQRAVQILYQWDMRKLPVNECLAAFYDTLYSDEDEKPSRPHRDKFMEELVHGTVEHVAALDERIGSHSENWRMERMPAVDRNILRLAVYEILYQQTPAPVVIDEALELARRFSGDESVAFVNGILDAIRKAPK